MISKIKAKYNDKKGENGEKTLEYINLVGEYLLEKIM